jgi:hypothetical protein
MHMSAAPPIAIPKDEGSGAADTIKIPEIP